APTAAGPSPSSPLDLSGGKSRGTRAARLLAGVSPRPLPDGAASGFLCQPPPHPPRGVDGPRQPQAGGYGFEERFVIGARRLPLGSDHADHTEEVVEQGPLALRPGQPALAHDRGVRARLLIEEFVV